jgi:hypothetical protein
MEIKTLRKKTIVRSAVYALILGCVTGITIYLGTIDTQVNEKHNFLKNDIASLSRKLQGLSEKALEFSESAKIWETFPKDQQNLQGLRINSAKDLLDKLQEQYKLSNVKLSFSKPEDVVSDDYKTETVSVVSSEVNIDFSAIDDEYVFNFIGAILKDFPGYVQVNSLSVTRSKDVAKDVLMMIAAGEKASLVDVKIAFLWKDLKYKGPSSAAANAEGAPPAGGKP